MKRTILAVTLTVLTAVGFAQKKTTTSATILFDASTSIDNLPKAENKTVIAALDTKSGDVAFEATVKNFAFANPTIQEHFNSKGWLNSDEFPTATFAGKIVNLSDVNFSKDGSYTAHVKGDLSIHGKTNPAAAKATITVKDGTISTNADFTISLSDYEVNGQAIDAGKVAKQPKISVKADF